MISTNVFPLSSFSAEYEISKGSWTLGVMSRRLEIEDGNRYVFESRMETKGLVSLFAGGRVLEISRGRIENARFLPEHYLYDKKDRDKNYELRFDYAAGRVSRSDAGQDWSVPMPPQVLDKLSYQAQMMVDVAGNPGALDYAIAERGKLKQYLIANRGREEIETAVGRFQTIKLERSTPDSKKRTTVWFAEALGWMPVKVEYRDKKGALTVAVLRSVSGAAP